jgi:hypothetical protein
VFEAMSAPRFLRGRGGIAEDSSGVLDLPLNDIDQQGGLRVRFAQHQAQVGRAHGDDRKRLPEIVHHIPEEKFSGPGFCKHIDSGA